MKSDVVLIGPDIDLLMGFSLALDARAYEITIVCSDEPLLDALNYPGAPAAMLVSLAGHENVENIRALLSAMPMTRFLLLTPRRPPSAALARIVRARGDVMLPVDELGRGGRPTLTAVNASRGVRGAHRA